MEKSDLKKVTSYLWVKILCASLIAAASLVMIVLVILKMANQSSGNPSIVFQIIIGAALILIGLTSSVITIVNDTKGFDLKAVIADGILVGSGIFVILAGEGALKLFVTYFIPSALIGVGFFLLIKSIVDFAAKNNATKTNIALMIAAIIIFVGGILLLVFADKVENVMWLILGVILLAYSIILLVRFIKLSKNKK